MEQNDSMHRSIHEDTLLERAIIPRAFRSLADTAESLCLSRPLERNTRREPSHETALLSKLGIHGLRMAIEIASGAEVPIETEDDASSVSATDVIRTPELFSHEPYEEAVAWAEDFGAALLDEAYQTLGSDVEAQLRNYRQATTPEEQLSVITWLNDRLVKMKETDDYCEGPAEDNGENYLLYHPLRLSPKAIGQYPDISLPPTCLGFSIIAASFMRAAGAETLHAGVMMTDGDSNTCEIMYQAELSAAEISKLALDKTALSASLISRNKEYFEQLVADRGYHAVALARLMDGTWCQIDSNYNATTRYDAEYMNEKIEQAYATLKEMRPIAPALEIGVSMNATTPLTLHLDQWRELSMEELDGYRTRIADILTGSDEESVAQRLHECIVDAHIALYPLSNDENEDIRKAERYYRDEFLFEDSELNEGAAYYSQQTNVADAIAHLLNQYVFYEEPVIEVMARCRSDGSYCERRVEDVLAIIPALRTTSADGLAVISEGYPTPHAQLEIGNTETRVGFAVFSDIASYFPNDVPATFWHASWPSLIPVTERAHEHGEIGQNRGIHNMLALVQAKNLRYTKDYAKIYSTIPPLPERR